MAGCGSAPLPIDQPLAPQTRVAARDYLRTSIAGARATRGYVAELERLPSNPSPAALKGAAPTLTARAIVTRQMMGRLAAMTLGDRRLEVQRIETVERLRAVVEAMDALNLAAAQGALAKFVSGRSILAAALRALRNTAK